MPLFAAVRSFASLARGLGFGLSCALAACQSAPKAGQSGSEYLPGDEPGAGGGSATVPCPCGREDVPALRVTVLAQDFGNYRLRVEEVLHGDLPLRPGDEIEADRGDDRFPCYLGCAAIAMGEQAFAFYRPATSLPSACPEREACIARCEEEHSEDPGFWDRDGDGDDDRSEGSGRCCRADPPSGFASVTGARICGYLPPHPEICVEPCTQGSRDRCPPPPEQDFKRGSVGLSPWGEEIVFARNARGEIKLKSSELSTLWRDEGLDERERVRRCVERVGDWASLLEDAP